VRRFPLALKALVALGILALVGGTITYQALDKELTLIVDGETREVSTFARTVGSVLAAEDITTGEHDIVSPAIGRPVQDGDTLVVRHSRLLRLNIDGAPREVWTTAVTVDEALNQLGLRDDRAYVSASRSRLIGRDGLDLQVRSPKTVTIAADGQQIPFTTTAVNVRDALAEAKVPLGPLDTVTPALDAPPTEGLAVSVTRIEVKTGTEQQQIPFATERRQDASLPAGTRKVAQSGVPGVKDVRLEDTYTNGALTNRAVLGEKVLRTPVAQITLVGTKARPVSGAGGSASGLNWPALARCESGGNPGAVSANGRYHGLYQFSVQTWAAVGGSGLPSQASSAEQTQRAQALYNKAGRGQWPHCGRYL
jgi:resuscitation-promoting factor RpfB